MVPSTTTKFYTESRGKVNVLRRGRYRPRWNKAQDWGRVTRHMCRFNKGRSQRHCRCGHARCTEQTLQATPKQNAKPSLNTHIQTNFTLHIWTHTHYQTNETVHQHSPALFISIWSLLMTLDALTGVTAPKWLLPLIASKTVSHKHAR